jgi:hypothetical protein
MRGIERSLAAVCLCVIVGGAWAAEPGDAATRFFKNHPNAIDAEEQDGSILFANRQIGLEFRKSGAGFELARLYGIVEDQDYLTAPKAGAPRNLFEIRMALDPNEVGKDERGTVQTLGMRILEEQAKLADAFWIGSQSAKSVFWKLEKGEKQSALRLQWKGMDVRENKAALGVEVSITLREGDPFSYWRIAIHNESVKYGIERARLPIVPLAPVGEAKKDVFIYPKWRGGYAEDPFNAPRGFGEDFHTVGAYYPYYVNMQFWALYNRETGKGIYLGTHDPTPCMTHFLVDNTPTEISWSVSHFPPNMMFGAEDFNLPYDCVVGPFRGDWYDACQIYREWALKQTWCRKGPMATRNDIPKWYKETPLFFYAMVADSATGTHSDEENMLLAAEDFRAWLKWAGVRMPVNWYGWEKHTPGVSEFDTPFSGRRPRLITSNVKRWAGLYADHCAYSGNYPGVAAMDKFSALCADLRRAGGMVCPYICLQLFNQGPLENAPYAAEGKLNAVHGMYGALQVYPGYPQWVPCVCTPWWQNRMVDECVTLRERENVGGYYLDVMHGFGMMPCFWIAHGHAAGGGSTMTLGMHKISEMTRDAVQAKDPELMTTGEDSTENMIDVVDGILYQRTLRPENKAPLFGVVYQDYIRRYGCYVSVGPGDSFFIECASFFVEGAQFGRLALRPRPGVLFFDNPAHKEMIDFLGRVVGYYKQDTAKKFLVYGRLLRPLEFSAPSPLPMLTYKDPEPGLVSTDTGAALGHGAGLQFPSLMSGVFRCADGELGVFIVNAGAKSVEFNAELDPARYEVPAGTALDVDSIAPDGAAKNVLEGAKGNVPLNGTLPAHGMTMFRLKLAGQP